MPYVATGFCSAAIKNKAGVHRCGPASEITNLKICAGTLPRC